MTTFTTTATITCARNKMEETPKAHITFQTENFFIGGISYDYMKHSDYAQIRQITKLFGKEFLEDLSKDVTVRIIAKTIETHPMYVDALAIGHPNSKCVLSANWRWNTTYL